MHADALRAVVATAMACAAGSTARTRREPRRMRSASRCFIVLSKICESDFTYYTDTATERRHARIEGQQGSGKISSGYERVGDGGYAGGWKVYGKVDEKHAKRTVLRHVGSDGALCHCAQSRQQSEKQ